MTRPHDEMTLFQRAIERPEAEREAFVRAQSDDPALVERVLELLRDREAAGEGFLEEVVSGAAASFSPAPIPTALGQFELLHPIGHGGMGIVYEARDLRLGRKVAVKLLAAHLTASELNRARFRNEAKIVAGLSHPGIVPVYSYDEADGHMYIVCELIGGESLGTLLEREKQAGSHEERALSDARIAQIVAAVAEALGYAHGMGVIHRDVKPANILLTPDGSPRLTDFGIAKLLTDDAGVTSPGAGTVQYMSPEQIDALDATVDHRTDIFSLGVVLYEMLTGRLPFRGESREQIVGSLRTSEPTAPQKLVKGIPRDLQTICLKALEKRPRDRYQSAAHFAADLHSFLAGAPILARPRSPIEHALRRFYTRRRAIGVGLAVVGAAAGGYGWNNWLRDTRARVRLTGVGDDAQLAVQIFDPESQRFVAHDNVTLTHGINRLPAGHYRFVVRDSSGYAEISRTLQDGDDIELSPRILPTRSVTESMALIPSGSDSGFRAAISGEDAYFSLARQLPAFWIDRTEVSNAEYRRFVDATGHEPWWNDEYDAAWDQLPVVHVSGRDAQAYAGWVGKRLPTALEWKRAARGTSGRLFPWGDEGEDDPDLVRSRVNAWKETMGPYNRWIGDRGLVAHYISNVHPTDDTTTDDLCDGNLLHMFGNVQEWTETPQDPTRFGLPADPLSRVICGASWGNPPQNNWTFESEGFGSMDGAIMGRGFRCAKSALE